MNRLILCAAVLLLAGCHKDKETAEEKKWRADTRLIKICRDGSHIFRMPDGTYRTGGLFSSRVENPETVCSQ